MASPDAFASRPDPPRTSSTLDVDALKYEISVQKVILSSLEDTPVSSDRHQQEAAARHEIRKLRERLARAKEPPILSPYFDFARRESSGSPHLSPYFDFPKPRSLHLSEASTPSRMSTPDQSSSSSGFGLPSQQCLPHRKRKFPSDLAADPHHVPGYKSMRPTPSSSPFLAPSSSSSPRGGSDELAYIDLTGEDDDEASTEQQKRLDAYRRNYETIKGDEALARQLNESNTTQGSSSQPYTGVGANSGGISAFDRIMARSSHNGVSGHPTQQPQQLAGYDHNVFGPRPISAPSTEDLRTHRASLPYQPNSAMPAPQPRFSIPGSYPETEAYRSAPQYSGSPESRNWANTNRALPSRFPTPSGVFQSPRFSVPEPTNPGILGRNARPSSGGLTGVQAFQPSFGNPNHSHLPAGQWPTAMSRPSTADRPNGEYNRHLVSQRPSNSLRDIIDLTANRDYDNPAHRAFLDYDEVDPQKSDQEIKDLLSNIRPDEEIPAEQREGTPDALRYPLYSHQQLALQWMKSMEEGANKGGILADDMGLGKTLSTLSLMVSRPSEDREFKTNLIIGPVSLIRQWRAEIKNKLKTDSHSLSVFLLHGKKKPSFEEMRRHDVVLTTYGTVAQEWKRYGLHIANHPGQDPDDSSELAKNCPILHGKSKWYRIILDEAQCIKNKETQSAKAAHQIVATYRWCLTGTPMMNSVSDLYPLFQFLRIKPYMDHKKFNADFGCLVPSKREGPGRRDNALQKLRAVLKATMLRRMKDSKLDGKPILNLPPKVEEVVHVLFSEDETSFYQALEQQSRVQFNKYLRAGTVGKNYSHILVLLLRLRQACCHPHLHDDFDTVGIETSAKQMVALAKSMQPDVVTRIKAKDASFDCPICFDAVLNPVFVLPCGHNLCSACLQLLETNATQSGIRDGREGGGTMTCVECRGPVDLKNVVDYDAFILAHMPEKAAERGLEIEESVNDNEDDEDDTDTDDDDDDDSTDNDDTVDDNNNDDGDSLQAESKDASIANDADENGNVEGFVVPDDDDDDGYSSDESLDISPSRQLEKDRAASKAGNPERKEPRKRKKSKGKKKAVEVKPHMLKTLRMDSRKNKQARRKYMHYLRDHWEPSAKVTKACEIVMDLRDTEEKTIIFSVFTGLLDLLEVQIKYQLHIEYCRYDGGMSATQRDEAVRKFTDDPDVKVMLVSLKAGNSGLNLTAASQVIIMDPFWNPYIEMQAVDRAHRIGQQRPVKVHRLLVEGTVEDKIIELQERKRKLVNAALDEGASRSLGRLSTEELRSIFGVNN